MTSGLFRGTLPWKPYFHPCGFPGAASSHSAFSSWGEGAVQSRPRPLLSRQPPLSGPQFSFPCLPLPLGLGCRPSVCCTLSQTCTPTLTLCRCVRSPPTQGLCSRIPRQGRDPPNPGLYARQRPEGWIPGSRTSAPRPVVCRHSPVIQRVPQSAPSFRIPHPALWRSPGSQP